MFILNYSTVIDPLLKDVRTYAPEFSGMKARDRVLDVCCGTGDQVFHYAKRSIIATGIDLDPNMIELARRRKRRQGLTNVSFHVADASSLPFKNDSFDYASISFALHQIERASRDRVISEMKRVVKKEGDLIFIDFHVPLPENLYGYLIKIIEFIAGGGHFRNFKDYVAQGGLDEILMGKQLAEGKRGYLKNGIITIIKARNV